MQSVNEALAVNLLKPEKVAGKVIFKTLFVFLAVLGVYLSQQFFVVHDPKSIMFAWGFDRITSERLNLGVVISICLGLFFGLLVPRSTKTWYTQSDDLRRSNHLQRFLYLGIGLLAFACLLIGVAMFLYATGPETAMVRGLWFGGVFAFFASQVGFALAFCKPHAEAEFSPAFTTRQLLLLLLLLIAGFYLRAYQIVEIPMSMHHDNALTALEARTYVTGENPKMFGVGWAQIPRIAFLWISMTMSVFGTNVMGHRMAEVIAGTITLLGTYLFVWRAFDSHRTAAIATAILVGNAAHNHYSRVLLNMEPWAHIMLGLFFAIHGCRARQFWALGIAGVFIGFSLQLYLSGRIIAIVLAVFGIYLLAVQRKWLLQNKLGLAMFCLGAFISWGPNIVDVYMKPENWLSRVDASIFAPNSSAHAINAYKVSTISDVIVVQIWRTLLMFQYYPDTSTQTGEYLYPMFDLWLAPLIWLGIGYAIVRSIKSPPHMLLIMSLLLTFAIGSVIATSPPYWPRMVFVMILASIFIAIAIDRLWDVLRPVLPSKTENYAVTLGLSLCVALLVGFVAIRQWQLYYKSVKNDASSPVVLARYISSFPQETKFCGVGEGTITLREHAVRFMAYPRVLHDLPSQTPVAQVDQCGPAPFVWVLPANQTTRLNQLKTIYPKGKVETFRARDNNIIFNSFVVESK